MKNFNELFEEAKGLNDRRKKAFSDLKNKFNSEILPEFAKVLDMCDYSVCYFHSNIKIFAENMSEYVDYGSEGYQLSFCFGITKDGEIKNINYEPDRCTYDYNDEDGLKEIRNVGILELVRLVNSRLEKYTEKMHKNSVKAESYIES